jgi:hypothetical protein
VKLSIALLAAARFARRMVSVMGRSWERRRRASSVMVMLELGEKTPKRG